MYTNKLVAAIKTKGQVLREKGDAVFIPFGSEYVIYIKNLNSVRAQVSVSIDGSPVTGESKLLIEPNKFIELNGFPIDKNQKVRAFKFIRRTEKIEKGKRGALPEDGLIRIEFEFERQSPRISEETIVRRRIHEHEVFYYPQVIPYAPAPWTSPPWQPPAWYATSHGVASSVNAPAEVLDHQELVGITAPGSVMEVSHLPVGHFVSDGQSHVLVLRLFGQVGEEAVKKPVTVKTKISCSSCGSSNRFDAKFCSECGTRLNST